MPPRNDENEFIPVGVWLLGDSHFRPGDVDRHRPFRSSHHPAVHHHDITALEISHQPWRGQEPLTGDPRLLHGSGPAGEQRKLGLDPIHEFASLRRMLNGVATAEGSNSPVGIRRPDRRRFEAGGVRIRGGEHSGSECPEHSSDELASLPGKGDESFGASWKSSVGHVNRADCSQVANRVHQLQGQTHQGPPPPRFPAAMRALLEASSLVRWQLSANERRSSTAAVRNPRRGPSSCGFASRNHSAIGRADFHPLPG